MKTYNLIFALSFISSITFAQTQNTSRVGTLAGNGGGAAAASYAATGKAILPSDTSKVNNGTARPKNIALSGGVLPGGSVISSAVRKQEPAMPARISTNMTVSRQTQGATFGEKVNQGLHAAGSAVASGAAKTDNPVYEGNSGAQNNPLHKSEAKVASPGNPIGGIIVKGGKSAL